VEERRRGGKSEFHGGKNRRDSSAALVAGKVVRLLDNIGKGKSDGVSSDASVSSRTVENVELVLVESHGSLLESGLSLLGKFESKALGSHQDIEVIISILNILILKTLKITQQLLLGLSVLDFQITQLLFSAVNLIALGQPSVSEELLSLGTQLRKAQALAHHGAA